MAATRQAARNSSARVPGAAPAILRAALRLGPVLVLVVACREPQHDMTFRDAEALSGRATTPAATSAFRQRVQHTRGTVGQDLFPCVSPDGATLFFASSRFSTGFDIVAKPLDGYTLTFLTHGPHNDLHPDVSPDGSTVAFASDRAGVWAIYLLPAAETADPLLLAPAETDTVGPRWSPDGRRLACFRHGAAREAWEIWLIDLETGAQSYLTDGLFPAWSPDGRSIVFQRARRRGEQWYSLWRIDVEGGRLVDLMGEWSDEWGAIQPVWSADGRWIAFAAVGKNERMSDVGASLPGRAPSDLYVIAATGGQLLDLTGERPGISEWSPRFGPDGRIYYSARETDGATRVWSVAWPAEAAPLGPAALPAETAPAAAPTAADGMPGEATRA